MVVVIEKCALRMKFRIGSRDFGGWFRDGIRQSARGYSLGEGVVACGAERAWQ